jgi:predicted anti-sigma-YlaC factor YlaD
MALDERVKKCLLSPPWHDKCHVLAEREVSVSETRGGTFARVVAILVGLLFAGVGVWAMVDPRSFFETVALFQPYNQHLLQDVGAFQVGLGAVLLLAAWRPRAPALAIALLGVGVGAALHALSHIIGRDLGGNPQSDIPLFIVVAALALVAGALSWTPSA